MIDDDSRLMLAFKGGDRGAFDELFRLYTPRLMSFLARMVRDRARAEELTQDVFVRIYQARERYEPRAKFSTWLFRIAHNLDIGFGGKQGAQSIADDPVIICQDHADLIHDPCTPLRTLLCPRPGCS